MADLSQNLPNPVPAKKKVYKPPILGVGDVLGAGDTYLVADFLPPEQADGVFEKLQAEVKWQNMYHRGGDVPRLVAVEGEVAEDGSYPIYRHPADRSPPLDPFSATVAMIRAHVEKALNHPVNHVLIQLYRGGKDCISEHSDKTIDVVPGSSIVNVSFGAERTMTLRQKRDRTVAAADELHPPPRPSQRIPLPHNSLFVMGLATNAQWLHGINHDNRPQNTKAPAEQAYGGVRISLTFRRIGTFLSRDGARIWGQGARSKTQEDAGLVVQDVEEVKRLTLAFGGENQQSVFDWDATYGEGFDVLHFIEE
ncbi:hypothetical protein HYPSUDRAFT_47805 [Hypholoma sublateritium FD-334 SS-4]|uniref:Fe2OG dioxygenase domain-containing protein n=1 Tax=Hypholoma sublateritium (strain FD-334 SS-4) TaxID=945553 RepID=A0A0D2NAA2_HYPSF|nr:hypothetical protein HYPSUDRAFT_47805 [Hypholoma sublateritium FD-334 SS-4]